MSLVGPFPITPKEVGKNTEAEKQSVTARPRITDIASIVFSEEGVMIKDAIDTDDSYYELIRAFISRLGILYAQNRNVILGARLIPLTFLAVLNKPKALSGVQKALHRLPADPAWIAAFLRRLPHMPANAPL